MSPGRNAAVKGARRHRRINPLSGAALAVVLTAPVIALGMQPGPTATTGLPGQDSGHGPGTETSVAASSGDQGQAANMADTAGLAPGTAPDGPGTTSRFDLARKDCVGTAAPAAGRPSSTIWYTVANGVLSDVYEPTVDNSDVATLQWIVTDGATFTDAAARDLSYTVSADASGMTCTVTATSATHGYQLSTTYLTDPNRDAVLMRTRLGVIPGTGTSLAALHLYARLDAHVNGNGGGGGANGGADTGAVVAAANGGVVPVIYDTSVTSQATNRNYAEPTYMALRPASPAHTAGVGYAGTASDGLTELDASHALTAQYTAAPDGHIVATLDATPPAGPGSAASAEVTLTLGFGRTESEAIGTAGESARQPFSRVLDAYQQGWRAYDSRLRRPPAALPELTAVAAARVNSAYYLSANVLKASEDKTFSGAIVASLASPWGQAVSAGAAPGGQPVFFGSYREVFSRDLYEVFTGLLADGDLATARAAALFLLTRQQLATGEIPRNSLLNGMAAPDTGGDQLDETAYPILMAYQSGLGADAVLWRDHIRPAADFLVAHGPAYGVERWEEQSGYSPSTIAAQIAGLSAAATVASRQGDHERALLYQAVADDFQRNVTSWTVTSTGPDAARYFIRLAKTGDPDAAISYGLGNGGPTLDQRQVLDGGFQELLRLGELPASDPDMSASLAVWDAQMSVTTPSGIGYYRYGDVAARGSADGYGDCYHPSQTSCGAQGEPWPTTGTGTGHLWPLLSGERAESDITVKDLNGAAGLLTAMMNFSAGVGLVPEQDWEDPSLPPSPPGTDPALASAGFTDGGPADSAAPLSWAQAQELRLIQDLGAGRVLDEPAVTADRYVRHTPPASVGVTLTAPAGGDTIEGAATTVSGTTAPGAHLVIASAHTGTAVPAQTVTTTAAADGSFSVSVPIGFGTDVLTVGAGAGSGTGYAQVTVVGDIAGGTTVLDVTDPAGDDNGPGTFQYPTAQDFSPGSFDITRFQVITAGPEVYLRTTLRTMTPTFGQLIGAQLLDIYVHVPGALATTAAAYPSRNYTIAAADAWSQRIEAQGFAPPVWAGPPGDLLGAPAVVASAAARTITIALPLAVFGTPAPGWSFAVVLTGQDGFSTDQARGFATAPQPFLFGLCVPGGTDPVCAIDPATAPKAMDVLTPPGVAQSAELDPTHALVQIQAIPVP
jgi:glucoamylase